MRFSFSFVEVYRPSISLFVVLHNFCGKIKIKISHELVQEAKEERQSRCCIDRILQYNNLESTLSGDWSLGEL